MNENESLEEVIISNLLSDPDFSTATIPFLKKEYFEQSENQAIFEIVHAYIDKYDRSPSWATLAVELEKLDIDEKTYKDSVKQLARLQKNRKESLEVDREWLRDETELWCRNRACYNAILEGIENINDFQKFEKTGLPERIQEALAIQFDSRIGHNYFEDAEERWEYYHAEEFLIPFGTETFNKALGNGLKRATLTCIMSTTTGGFKSGTMCSWAADWIRLGYNVLYCSMEMGEEDISQRIDANILETDINALKKIPKKTFTNMINQKYKQYTGRLIVKDYPTSSVHVGHIRHLLKELKRKQNFIPDVICIDYLNIMLPKRQDRNMNSYTSVKNTAEELRALAKEFDVAMVTATQSNRVGFNNNDIDIDATSESFGLPSTLDYFLAVIKNEEFDSEGKIMFKKLKIRGDDLNHMRRFFVGADLPKMKLFDLDNPTDGLMTAGVNAKPSSFTNDSPQRFSPSTKAKNELQF